MKGDVRTASLAAAVGLAAAGGVLCVSLVAHLRSGGVDSTLLAAPGAFLFTAFQGAAFFVPAYLLACAWIVASRPFDRGDLLALTLMIFPFLTAALALKTLFEEAESAAPVTMVILAVFGRIPGVLFLAALLGLELLAIYRLRALPSPHSDDAAEESRFFRPDLKQRVADRESVRETPDPEEGWRDPGRFEVPGAAAAPTDAAASSEGQDYREVEPLEAEAVEELAPAPGPRRTAFTPMRLLPPDAVVAEAGSAAAPGAQPPAALPAPELEPEAAPIEEGVAPGITLPPPRKGKRFGRYSVPVKGILVERAQADGPTVDKDSREAGSILMSTLEEFSINAELTGIRRGPVITMFEILPSPGVKLSKIVNLADNIALRLAAPRVRIVAPIPGKHAVGIEVPNKRRSIVSFRDIISLDLFKDSHLEIPLAIGKGISGEAHIVDLVQMPHLLIAGATGSGKSVCVNSIIASVLYRRTPNEVKLLLIDPKIVELKLYNDIPHLLTPVITEPKRAFRALQYCIYEMERRYSLLDSLGVRDIRAFNRKIKKNKIATSPLPYIVIVVDEFADLMATIGREMESTLARLAAMSRAVGIHLVLATQRPSVDVITGLIKANIPSRIAFMVASKVDSRIIIDVVGADKLLGQGDMLFTPAWDPVPVRIQGAYLGEEEIEALTAYVKTLGEPEYIDEAMFLDDEEEDVPFDAADDPLMEKALEIVVTAGKASASYLQRRLQIGYNRAARLVEAMEQQGIVGPAQGSKPREILHVPERVRD